MLEYQDYAEAFGYILNRQGYATFLDGAIRWLENHLAITGRRLTPKQVASEIKRIAYDIEEHKAVILGWINKNRPAANAALPVCAYYFANSDETVLNRRTARLCLARAGFKTAGFKSTSSVDDFLKTEYTILTAESANGKAKKALQRKIADLKAGMISRGLSLDGLDIAMDANDILVALLADVRHSTPPA